MIKRIIITRDGGGGGKKNGADKFIALSSRGMGRIINMESNHLTENI